MEFATLVSLDGGFQGPVTQGKGLVLDQPRQCCAVVLLPCSTSMNASRPVPGRWLGLLITL